MFWERYFLYGGVATVVMYQLHDVANNFQHFTMQVCVNVNFHELGPVV